MKSQCQQIESYLRSGRTLTVMEAIKKFGCYSLSQRCTELRERGVPVKSVPITTRSKKRIALYWLPSGKRSNA